MSETQETAREVMADALVNDAMLLFSSRLARDEAADSILAALDAAGLVVVPREEHDEAKRLLQLWVDRECAHTYPVEECVPCGDRDAAAAFVGDERRTPASRSRDGAGTAAALLRRWQDFDRNYPPDYGSPFALRRRADAWADLEDERRTFLARLSEHPDVQGEQT